MRQKASTLLVLLACAACVAPATLHGAIASAAGTLFEATPFALNGRGMSAQVTLACGIIAFPQSGPPRSGPVPARQPELDPSVAT